MTTLLSSPLGRHCSLFSLACVLAASACTDPDDLPDDLADTTTESDSESSKSDEGDDGTGDGDDASADDGQDDGQDDGDGDGSGGEDGGDSAKVEWGDCPANFISECASLEVPLDWDERGGDTIEISISKKPARDRATRQLWLLQGGPGGSGDVFSQARLHDMVQSALPDTDVYVLEHRGVGASTRLGCSAEAPDSEMGVAIAPAEFDDCLEELEGEWGSGLAHMTISNAAHDLRHAIESTREEGQESFVYGVSYGVLWTLRYLQLYPDEISGVILDSLPAPGVQFLSDFDSQYDPVFEDLLGHCARDETCSEKLGEDPWLTLEGLPERLDAGHCEALGFDGAGLAQFGAFLIQSYELRRHVLPLLYRIDRCDEADVASVTNYVETLNRLLGGDPQEVPPASSLLQLNIVLSELWELPPPKLEDLEERCTEAFLCPHTWDGIGRYYEDWPKYEHEEWTNGWPETSVPALSLNGDLDPQTPHQTAREVEKHLDGDHQYYIEVPTSPHGVVFYNPTATQPGQAGCGMKMMREFLDSPQSEPDSSCIDAIEPRFFSEAGPVVSLLFGAMAEDMWENSEVPRRVDLSEGPRLAGRLRATPGLRTPWTSGR